MVLPLLVIQKFGPGITLGVVLGARLGPNILAPSLVAGVVARMDNLRVAVVSSWIAAALVAGFALVNQPWQLGGLTANRFAARQPGPLHLVFNLLESLCWIGIAVDGYLPVVIVACALAGVFKALPPSVFDAEVQRRLSEDLLARTTPISSPPATRRS